MEEIAENNKLIAEFMGYENVKIESKEAGCRIPAPPGWEKQFPTGVHRTFSYNEDWNQLILVVEKIESLDLKEWFYKWELDGEVNYNFRNLEVEILNNTCSVILDLDLDPSTDLAYYKAETKIKATYKTIVEFIKWYNEKKKENDSTGI